MSWFAWFMLGVLAGLALLGMLLAAVGRESEERGGTLDLSTREARAALRDVRCINVVTDQSITGELPEPGGLPPAEAAASDIRESFAGSNDALGKRLRDGAA